MGALDEAVTTLASSAAGLGPVDDLFGLISHGGAPPAPRMPQQAQQTQSQSSQAAAPPTQPTQPQTPSQTTPQQQQQQPAAPPPGQYDLNADPVLQQVNAITLLADQNAQTAALRNREQMLLNYGDPALAASVLGADDPYVQAAGQNQQSTLAQLLRSYHHGLQNFDATLDPSLAFSGYRIGQEGQIGQDYQDSLAQAAAGLQSGLGSVTDQLNQQLQADNAQRAQALADAYQRFVQNALANPPARGGKKGRR